MTMNIYLYHNLRTRHHYDRVRYRLQSDQASENGSYPPKKQCSQASGSHLSGSVHYWQVTLHKMKKFSFTCSPHRIIQHASPSQPPHQEVPATC
jgi:hypothetical protein